MNSSFTAQQDRTFGRQPIRHDRVVCVWRDGVVPVDRARLLVGATKARQAKPARTVAGKKAFHVRSPLAWNNTGGYCGEGARPIRQPGHDGLLSDQSRSWPGCGGGQATQLAAKPAGYQAAQQQRRRLRSVGAARGAGSARTADHHRDADDAGVGCPGRTRRHEGSQRHGVGGRPSVNAVAGVRKVLVISDEPTANEPESLPSKSKVWLVLVVLSVMSRARW